MSHGRKNQWSVFNKDILYKMCNLQPIGIDTYKQSDLQEATTLKVTMEVKLLIIFVLFACVWIANGCNRKTTTTNTCSGYATCHIRGSRSLDNHEKRRTYSIITPQGDPCSFNTYDDNRDGTITKRELQDLLCINQDTDALFADLNILEDDGVIKPYEFLAMAPLIITDCISSDN